MTCTWSERRALACEIAVTTIYTIAEVEAFLARVELSTRDATAIARAYSGRGWSLDYAYASGPDLVSTFEFGGYEHGSCEDPRPYDAGLYYGPDLARRGMTGARTGLALASSRSR